MNAITELRPDTALAVIPATAISTIIAADTDDILGAYAAKVRAFRPDISTQRGRDEIKSLAAEGRRVKASLLRMAAGLKENALKTQRAINAEEKIVEERMNALVENIRAPLTELENAEKARVAGHEAALARMQELASASGADSAVGLIDTRMEELARAYQRDWQHDFAARASDVYDDCLGRLRQQRDKAVQREAEAAELARLRAEAEERARQEAARLQAEREARIATEAADKARRDAEAKAERERQETLRAAAEERARVERAAQAREYARRLIQHIVDCGLGFIGGQPYPYSILVRELDEKITLDEDTFGDLLPEAVQAHQQAKERVEAGMKAATERRRAEAERQAAHDRAEEAERRRVADAEAARAREEAAARKAETDRIAAEQKAKRDQEAAVAAERKRQADEQARQEREAEAARAEAERRAANKAHQAAVNNAAVKALLALTHIDEQTAKQVVVVVARGEIPKMKMEYSV